MGYIILFLAVVIGVSIAYFFEDKTKFSKRLLMFSAGLLLSITVLEMFPMLYAREGLNAGVWIMAGVCLQLVLEGISKGIEHGHMHHHKIEQERIVPISVILGLFIHSFLDGIPLESQHIDHHHGGHGHDHGTESHSILWALSIHKVSESIVLATFLFSFKIKKSYIAFILILFAFSAPIGGYMGTFISADVYFKLLGIVAGIFLHISSIIIFESSEKHNTNWIKMLFVLIGMVSGYLITSL